MRFSRLSFTNSSLLPFLLVVVVASIAMTGNIQSQTTSTSAPTSMPMHNAATMPLVSFIKEGDDCLSSLPEWVKNENSDSLAKAFIEGSKDLTDKSTAHRYQIMYHRYLSPMVLRKCFLPHSSKLKFRMLEIGLGCAPGGGMKHGQPGGSTFAWKHLFPPELFELDLHVMEFDTECASKWHRENPGIATMVHSGDASSSDDLDRVFRDSGGIPFDMIIDDASHLNEHQIATFIHMIPRVAKGGFFVIEDIVSSCFSWRANVGTKRSNFIVKGTPDCMETSDGKPTIFSKLIEWQKPLLQQKSPFENVTSIEIHFEAAVVSKQH